jgi:hypothetical protein
MQAPPESLVDWIAGEIQRGTRALQNEQVVSGFAIDSVQVRILLGAEWRQMTFDKDGRLVPDTDLVLPR